VCGIFSQLLQLFPRLEFEQLVRQHRAERHARGFTCWEQFIAMLFCQLGGAHFLRKICGDLTSCECKLRHLGLPEAPKRSTLAYANEHRPWPLFQGVFQQLYHRCQGLVGAQRSFRFRYRLVILDSPLRLALRLGDLQAHQAKGTVKLHLLLDHQGYLPQLVVITPGKVQDIEVARIYRERWQVEVFFRTLKQNLRVKSFVGTGANALKIQIWTALIALFLLKYLQLLVSYGWSLSNLVALLRQQLFVYRDLLAWLHQPLEPSPDPSPAATQLPLLSGVEA
jgi:hypothetical protein